MTKRRRYQNMKKKNFASDNNAGMSPEALKGFIEANNNHQAAYGDDQFTSDAKASIKQWIEKDCEIHFVAGGTPANCLSIAASIRNYQSVICHEYAHIQNDECHAPGFFNQGIQLRLLTGELGKLSPEQIAPVFEASHGVHGTLPGLVSITQSTEAGTNYTIEEIKDIADEAHRLGLLLHMDGARFCNALIDLHASPAEMSWKAGVDLLSLGGVKNGLAFGEALLVLKDGAADHLDYRIKQSGQLTSKMRFISNPWHYYLQSGEWKRNAEHSNRMARILAEKITAIQGIDLLFPIESNAIFCSMPEKLYNDLSSEGWIFYPFPQMNGYRLMCAWDTDEDSIDAFVADASRLIG